MDGVLSGTKLGLKTSFNVDAATGCSINIFKKVVVELIET
jgi:hypothetical protein